MSDNQLMNLNQLKSLGIDFKISKSDILDMLVEQARVNLTEEVDAAKNHADGLADEYNALKKSEEEAHVKAEFDAVVNDPKVVAMKAALEAYYNCKLTVHERRGRYFLLNEEAKDFDRAADLVDDRDRFWGPPRAFYLMEQRAATTQVRAFNLERRQAEFKLSDKASTLKKEWQAANKAYEALNGKLRNFQYDASRARLKVLRDLLSVTEEGQQLLSLLDSTRNGKQIISALKKSND